MNRSKIVEVHWGDNTPRNRGLLDCASVFIISTCHVDGTHVYQMAGTYTIRITYHFLGKVRHVTTTASISSVPQSSFVILTIGDSVASGEGSPDVSYYPVLGRKKAYWDDPPSDYNTSHLGQGLVAYNHCHRSNWSGFSQAAEEVYANNPGITTINVACSGNTVSQAISSLEYARQYLPRIDVLVISVGADDIDGGFTTLLEQCLLEKNACPESTVTDDVSELSKKYEQLAEAINCQYPEYSGDDFATDKDDPTGGDLIGVDTEPAPAPESCGEPGTPNDQVIPKLVLLTEYYDPTDKGGLDVGSKIPLPVLARLNWLYQNVVIGMNGRVDDFPELALSADLTAPTYAVTGLMSDFFRHGYYNGYTRWVNTVRDSCLREGHCVSPNGSRSNPAGFIGSGTSGAGHPNIPALTYMVQDHILANPGAMRRFGGCFTPVCGQGQYKNFIYNAIVEYNPPVTSASAIQGQGETGGPYQFNTWTNKNVTVTIFKPYQAIKESGIGATYYGVDDPNCTSTFAGRTNCTKYSGAFTIDTSGQHTVTFFATNAAGYPEQVQTVQVLIDKSGYKGISITPNTQTINAGSVAEYSVTLGRMGWPASGTVTLTCQTTDPYAMCTMQPGEVKVNGSNPPASTAVISTQSCSQATSGGTTCIPPGGGTYTVTVMGDGAKASATLVVDPDPITPSSSGALVVGSGPSKDGANAARVVDSDHDAAAEGNR